MPSVWQRRAAAVDIIDIATAVARARDHARTLPWIRGPPTHARGADHEYFYYFFKLGFL
jgi:hypothetical protein